MDPLTETGQLGGRCPTTAVKFTVLASIHGVLSVIHDLKLLSLTRESCNVAPHQYAQCLLRPLIFQAFLNSGDVSQVDQQLLVQVLSAAATAAGAGSPTQAATPSTAQQHLLQLQQQLGCLSADACLLLLEELLLPAFTSGSSSSGAAQAQAAAGNQQLPASALAFFLQHAVLPQLQTLGAAAPKSMCGCLAALGELQLLLLLLLLLDCVASVQSRFRGVCHTEQLLLYLPPPPPAHTHHC